MKQLHGLCNMLRLNMITDIVERKKPTAEKSNTEMNYTTRNGLAYVLYGIVFNGLKWKLFSVAKIDSKNWSSSIFVHLWCVDDSQPKLLTLGDWSQCNFNGILSHVTALFLGQISTQFGMFAIWNYDLLLLGVEKGRNLKWITVEKFFFLGHKLVATQTNSKDWMVFIFVHLSLSGLTLLWCLTVRCL